jgi:hypothetical protein
MEEEGRSLSGTARCLRKAIWDNDMERLEELTKDYSADELREIVNIPRRRDGATPLIIASQEGYKEIVEYLLGAGANVNGANEILGTVPLGYAIMFEEAGTAQHDSIVHTFLDAGANVNATTKDGGTPLMIAAGKGKDNIVRALLDKGADVNATTTEGESPLMLAEKGDHKEIIDMLEAVRRVVKVKGDFSQEAIPLTGSKYDPYQPGGVKNQKKANATELGITIATDAQATEAHATVHKLESERRAGGKRKSKKKKSKKKKSKKKKTKRKR